MRRTLLLVVLVVAAACNGAETSTPTSVPAATVPTVPATAAATTTTAEATTRSPALQDVIDEVLTPTIGSPLPSISRSFDAEVADFTGDGRDDLLITRHQTRKINPDDPDGIWRWTPDGYELMFLFPMFVDRHGCTSGDVNGDGRLDAYCQLGGFLGSGRLKSNELWIQTDDGSFVDRAEEWGVTDPSGRGRWPLMFDFDDDGRADLYLTNQPGRSDDLRSENILYRNTGSGFEEVVTAVTGELGFRCLGAADFTGDGWLDLALCSLDGSMQLFRNDRGEGFTDITADAFDGPSGWEDVEFADLDDDGRVDAVMVRRDRVDVRINGGEGTWFTAAAASFELDDRGWDVAVGDFVGNARLDIYVVQQGIDCADLDTGAPNGRDVVLVGPNWRRRGVPNVQLGCGNEAVTVDGTTVLVTNGYFRSRGPIDLIDLRNEE